MRTKMISTIEFIVLIVLTLLALGIDIGKSDKK